MAIDGRKSRLVDGGSDVPVRASTVAAGKLASVLCTQGRRSEGCLRFMSGKPVVTEGWVPLNEDEAVMRCKQLRRLRVGCVDLQRPYYVDALLLEDQRISMIIDFATFRL